jgi:DnaJ family protein C protein 27
MSGDPTYIEVRNEFYKESQALVIVYDISRRQTFDALEMWLRELTKHGGENLAIFIVGNKTDLDAKRAV